MFKYSKLAIKTFIILSLAVLCITIMLIIISDPLRIYKSPKPNNNVYIDNALVAALTIMREHPFQSVIVGSSHSENTSSKEASDLFNSHFLNLSLSGATPVENGILLRYILKRQPVENIIYTLGDTYLAMPEKGGHNYNFNDWAYLYDDNRFNDIKVYFNNKYFFKTLTFQKHSIRGKKRDMDRPYSWYQKKVHNSRFGGFDNWIKHKDNSQIKDSFNYIIKANDIADFHLEEETKIKLRKYLYNNIILLAKTYPKTNFYIIITPICELKLVSEMRNGNLERRFYAERTLIELSQNYKNIKIYGFQDNINFAKIEKYKDLTHYNVEFNSYFLKSIKRNKHNLTVENINDYHNAVNKIARMIDYDYYKNIILTNGYTNATDEGTK